MSLANLPVMAVDADLAAAFAVLGQKRNGIILHTLATRPARFGELHAAIGSISSKMLADRLRELVDAGSPWRDPKNTIASDNRFQVSSS